MIFCNFCQVFNIHVSCELTKLNKCSSCTKLSNIVQMPLNFVQTPSVVQNIIQSLYNSCKCNFVPLWFVSRFLEIAIPIVSTNKRVDIDNNIHGLISNNMYPKLCINFDCYVCPKWHIVPEASIVAVLYNIMVHHAFCHFINKLVTNCQINDK